MHYIFGWQGANAWFRRKAFGWKCIRKNWLGTSPAFHGVMDTRHWTKGGHILR
jgi:hypothetical protein